MLFKIRNNRMGKMKLPDGQVIKKGEVKSVSNAVLTDSKIARLLSTGRFSIVQSGDTLTVTTSTQPAPPPVPEEPTPPPAPVPEEEDKPILKRRGRRKRTE